MTLRFSCQLVTSRFSCQLVTSRFSCQLVTWRFSCQLFQKKNATTNSDDDEAHQEGTRIEPKKTKRKKCSRTITLNQQQAFVKNQARIKNSQETASESVCRSTTTRRKVEQEEVLGGYLRRLPERIANWPSLHSPQRLIESFHLE